MADIIHLKEIPENLMKLGGRVEVFSSQDTLSYVFPQPLDYVEVRRMGSKGNEVYSKFCGFIFYCLTMLVAHVVKDDGDCGILRFLPYFFKSRNDFVWSASMK